MKQIRWIRKACGGLGMMLLLSALGLTFYNMWDADRAQRSAENTVVELEEYREEHPIYTSTEANPDNKMPEVEIDGQSYIGNIKISVLGIDLPVASQWSYEALKTSPCRYSGSVYQDNMVIAAHNYQRHFGEIPGLEVGTEIIFEDMASNQFTYTIEKIEVLEATQVEEMINSDSDLTLFTCNATGLARYAVRCKRSTDA